MTKPKLWCIETKSRVMDTCKLVHDGSSYVYQDFSSVGDSPEEACLFVQEYLLGLNFELEEVVVCQRFDLAEVHRTYNHSRWRRMVESVKESAFYYVDDYPQKDWLIASWWATQKRYDGYHSEDKKPLWVVSYLQTLSKLSASNYDGSDRIYSKLVVPADTEAQAVEAAFDFVKSDQENIIELLGAVECQQNNQCSDLQELCNIKESVAEAQEFNMITRCTSVSIEILDTSALVTAWVDRN